MNPVIHFEMPGDDCNRMASFYTNVFGWQAHFFGEEMGNYVTVTTTESDSNNRPVKPGGINGGFYVRRKDVPGDCPSIVIAVVNIEESIDKIKVQGGKVMGEPVEIPGVGKYVSFVDTEGNRVSILQPLM